MNSTPARNSSLTPQIDRPIVLTCVALAAGLAVIMFNAMPAIVGGAADSMGYSNEELGLIPALYLAGHTLSTLLLPIVIRHINWRITGLAGMLILATGFYFASLVSDLTALVTVLFCTGMGGGIVYTISMYAMSQSSNPDRAFGMAMLSQVGVGALAIVVFPAVIIPVWGFRGIMFALAATYLIAAILLLKYPRISEAQVSTQSVDTVSRLIPMCALVALACWLGLASTWGFLERVGADAGLDATIVGYLLAASLGVGALGAFTVSIVGERFGRRRPMLIVSIVMVTILLLLMWRVDLINYGIAVLIFQFGWIVGTVYIQGLVATTDQSGRFSAYIPLAMGVGGAGGPAVAGMISTDGYVPLYLFGIVLIVTSLILIFAASRSAPNTAQ